MKRLGLVKKHLYELSPKITVKAMILIEMILIIIVSFKTMFRRHETRQKPAAEADPMLK